MIIHQDLNPRFYKFRGDGAFLALLSFIKKNYDFEVASSGVLQGSGDSLVSEQVRLNVNAVHGGVDGPHDHGFAVVAGSEAHLTTGSWLFPVASLNGTVGGRSR